MTWSTPRWRSLVAGRWGAVVLIGAGIAASTIAAAQPHRSPSAAPSSNAPVDQAMASPDPPAIRSQDQFVLTFRYEAGKASLTRIRRVHLPQPRTTPRNAGRFALEMLSGPTLAERVRFDFPLLGADELAGKPRQFNAPPRFENKALVTLDVMVPDSSRFARARLIDRATGRVTPIAWPPDLRPDAGADAARGDASDSSPSGSDAAAGGDAAEAGFDAAQSRPDARAL